MGRVTPGVMSSDKVTGGTGLMERKTSEMSWRMAEVDAPRSSLAYRGPRKSMRKHAGQINVLQETWHMYQNVVQSPDFFCVISTVKHLVRR